MSSKAKSISWDSPFNASGGSPIIPIGPLPWDGSSNWCKRWIPYSYWSIPLRREFWLMQAAGPLFLLVHSPWETGVVIGRACGGRSWTRGCRRSWRSWTAARTRSTGWRFSWTRQISSFVASSPTQPTISRLGDAREIILGPALGYLKNCKILIQVFGKRLFARFIF